MLKDVVLLTSCYLIFNYHTMKYQADVSNLVWSFFGLQKSRATSRHTAPRWIMAW